MYLTDSAGNTLCVRCSVFFVKLDTVQVVNADRPYYLCGIYRIILTGFLKNRVFDKQLLTLCCKIVNFRCLSLKIR